MDPQDGGLCQGERLWLWLWLALLLTSASVAVTGSNCTCQGPVQGSCGYQKDDSRDNLYNTRNVALGKPARASSLFNSAWFNEVSGPACLAVNGDRNTTFAPCNKSPHNANCIHTAEGDRKPYWEVDLCDLYSIASITVYWRDAESQRNVDVELTVDGELCYIFEHPVPNPSTITCYERLSGQVVRLSKTDYWTRNDYYLTVCEVEVMGSNCTCQGHVHGSCDYRKDDFRANLSNTRNVALGKPAKASSLLKSALYNAVSGPACLAVNGDRNKEFRPCNQFPRNPSCIHTADDDREPYWEVDLCDVYSITSITVYWRNSKFQRNVGVNVTVDGKLCYIFEHPVSNPSTITCYQRLSGQIVRLSKTDYWTMDDYYLTLCEVEVTALNCTCHGHVHGSCDYRKDDFRDDLFNTRNVALGKPAKASSLLNSAWFNAFSGPACLAINGDRNTKFRPCNQFPNNSSCIHTADDDREPYWEVDLCDLYNITRITVYWRDSRFERNVDVKVTVDGKLCYIFDYPVSNPSTITCYQRLSGKTVRLSKTDYRTMDNYYLTVCQVEVMAKKSLPSTVDITSSAPLTPDVTRMALSNTGSFLCGCVVTGLCAALVLWLRRVKGRQRGCDSSSQVGDVIMTRENTRVSPLDAAECSGFAQSAAGTGQGPEDDDGSPDYINVSMDESLKDVLPKKKANAYKAFPTRRSDRHVATIPDSSSSGNEDYEEMM